MPPPPNRVPRLVRRLVALSPEAYYLPSEVAAYLRVATRTLANWRWKGGGPDYVKCGPRLVRYRGRDVLAWDAARQRRTTSDAPSEGRSVKGEGRRGGSAHPSDFTLHPFPVVRGEGQR